MRSKVFCVLMWRLRARPGKGRGGERGWSVNTANHIPNENIIMLHDVAPFMQNTFERALRGSKWIMCYVHNQLQKRSINESEMLLMLWDWFILVNSYHTHQKINFANTRPHNNFYFLKFKYNLSHNNGANWYYKTENFCELKDHLLPAWQTQYEFFSTIDCLILLALIYSL